MPNFSSQPGFAIASSGLRIRRLKIRPPAAKYTSAINAKLAVSACVLWFRKPIRYGPASPPSCPAELISPKVAAAADSLNNMVGIAQKTG